MFKKPIRLFLLGLTLFVLAFGVFDSGRLPLPPRVASWAGLISLFLSLLLALSAVIKGVRQIKRKENGFIYNLIAIIGSILILILLIFWGALLLSLYTGFPIRD